MISTGLRLVQCAFGTTKVRIYMAALPSVQWVKLMLLLARMSFVGTIRWKPARQLFGGVGVETAACRFGWGASRDTEPPFPLARPSAYVVIPQLWKRVAPNSTIRNHCPAARPPTMNFGKKDEDADLGLVKVDRTQVFQEGMAAAIALAVLPLWLS